MGDGSLTQDEIDALLQGADDFSAAASSGGAEGMKDDDDKLSPSEKDILAEIMQQALTRSSGSISSYVNKDVRFANAYTDLKAPQAIQEEFQSKYVSFQSKLSGSVSGDSHILMPIADAIKIAQSLLSQEEAKSAELDGAQEQAIKEMMSPMITAYFVNISHRANLTFGSGPINIIQIRNKEDLNIPAVDDYAKISFSMGISGLVDTKLIQILPAQVAQKIAQSAMKGAPEAAGSAMVSEKDVQTAAAAPGSIEVEDVEFPDLQSGGIVSTQANLNLLLDIKMDLTVELGRTRKYVKEILSLGEGSIIELDKLAGEPVDLLVNNKLIARGEVVVIDENFGVRVTDIVKPEERLKSMKDN